MKNKEKTRQSLTLTMASFNAINRKLDEELEDLKARSRQLADIKGVDNFKEEREKLNVDRENFRKKLRKFQRDINHTKKSVG